MSFSALEFLLFTALGTAVFYAVPKKARWVVLLILSYLYYLAAGPALIIFLLFVTASTYGAALLEERGTKAGVPVALLLNFGLLAYLKYTNFLIGILNHVPGVALPEIRLRLPLGISFYMFQATGYMLDVRWGRIKAERNIFRYALFVSFFPQIMQGPIGRYKSLSETLFKGADYDPENIRRGLWRILWGYLKKMLIADNAALWANAIFDNYLGAGKTMGIMGVLLYGVQLYMDFSGGIDIVIGIAEMLGIRLDENFRQPFFATSITDFWHRWHITLGTWMKDYLFYPLSLSKWMGRFGKWCRKRLGKQVGRAMPICVSNIIVFLVVGIWHGAAWHYILYGLYNGLIIGISGLLAPQYRAWKKAIRINDKSGAWHAFQVVRTFILVNISWFFDRGGVHQALVLMKNALSGPLFSLTLPFPGEPLKAAVRLGTVLLGVIVIFIVSLLKERKTDVRGKWLEKPAPVRIIAFVLLVLLLGFLGDNSGFGGFIYANF